MHMILYLLIFCTLCVAADLFIGQEQQRLEITVEEDAENEWLDRLAG